ncbi:hypothetical protein Q765_10990 [Flavobacterium rivuli WB 3.3-2 = DSM 21788]|uniref:Uncharacterized protein n=1 Tax=Flavobacterium rivuli WB 3.3-2 = DSM 21788 TaxID=1121895 RepID=A0A0A2M296_9FLAO|nr:hypothetical protein Q765_10990 [Flavobacterium rivuli WB 3.3-2 = DSM 21788]
MLCLFAIIRVDKPKNGRNFNRSIDKKIKTVMGFDPKLLANNGSFVKVKNQERFCRTIKIACKIYTLQAFIFL